LPSRLTGKMPAGTPALRGATTSTRRLTRQGLPHYSACRCRPPNQIFRRERMSFSKLVSACGVALLAAFSVAAQEPGNIAALDFQTPKNGMVKQYEAGRKQKADWHKQQKDSQPLLVWETMSGDYAGTYIVGRLGQHWSDFDKPSVPEAADLEEYNKVIGTYVQSVIQRYYEYMPKISNPMKMDLPPKMSEIITF